MTIEMPGNDPISEDYAIVACPAVNLLAKLHWYLLRSTEMMDAATIIRQPVAEGTLFVRPVRTDFGDEVGTDEIDWWVNRKETDLARLQMQTKLALDSAQRLKVEATKLRGIEPKTYEDLLSRLCSFAQQNEQHIVVLHEYVRWLYERNALAPIMLFAYRVWGSTRLSDRIIVVNSSGTGPEDDQSLLPLLALIVLGVVSNSHRQVDRVHGQISYEMYEQLRDGECDASVAVSPERLVRRTTWEVTDECATYFGLIRDSLRNILSEIDKRKSRENWLSNDAFWRSFILRSTSAGTLETDLWDFKEAFSFCRVVDRDARRRAKLDFARDVASFANARGGCIIVGVTDRFNVTGVPGPDKEFESILSTAEGILSEHLKYPRRIFYIRQVLVPSQTGDRVRCVVIAVGQASDVVAVRDANGQYTYPVRTSTGTVNGDPAELKTRRLHEKSDSFHFLDELAQYVRDN